MDVNGISFNCSDVEAQTLMNDKDLHLVDARTLVIQTTSILLVEFEERGWTE